MRGIVQKKILRFQISMHLKMNTMEEQRSRDEERDTNDHVSMTIIHTGDDLLKEWTRFGFAQLNSEETTSIIAADQLTLPFLTI